MTIPVFSQAFARKWKALLAGAALSVALQTTGCASAPNTSAGIFDGAVIGGFFGTLFGLACHRPLEGAAIGAGIGAGVGGATGAAEDHAERRAAEAQAAAVAEQQRHALTLQDIATLTANGTSDTIIINQIRTSGAVYALDAAALQYLHTTHVSEAVITEMQATATRPAPVGVQPIPVVYDPYAAPVVRVYAGGGWGWGGPYYRRGW
jgi:hypothetical protein